jgi:single-strand DNA-binding protein
MIYADIIGSLGKDAELKTNPQGKQFYSFSLAHNVKKGGQEETLWIGCTYFGVNDYLTDQLKKGKKVYVNGDLAIKTYEGKPDVTCYCSKIAVL